MGLPYVSAQALHYSYRPVARRSPEKRGAEPYRPRPSGCRQKVAGATSSVEASYGNRGACRAESSRSSQELLLAAPCSKPRVPICQMVR